MHFGFFEKTPAAATPEAQHFMTSYAEENKFQPKIPFLGKNISVT